MTAFAGKTAIIVVTGLAKIAWRLYRFFPGLILWILGREIKKARTEMRIDH